MDYILFNSDGSIKARNLTDYIQKGNDGVNSIFVSVEGIESADLDDYTCSANFLLPNDDIVATLPTQVTSADPVTIGGSDYVGWLVPIDAQVTQYEGQVKFSLVITNIVANPNTILLTFNAYLTINPSVLDPEEVNISVALYNELLTALNSLGRQKSDVNRVFITLDDISAADLTDYDEGQLFYDETTRNYYVKDSNNDPNYVIYSFVANYKHNLSSGDTLEQLKACYGSEFFLFKNSTDYGFCRIGYDSLFLGWTATVFYFGSGGTIKHYLVTNQNATTTLISIINGAATTEFASKNFVNNGLSTKQDTLTFDNSPTANSNNPVKSNGVAYYSIPTPINVVDSNTVTLGTAFLKNTDLAVYKYYRLNDGFYRVAFLTRTSAFSNVTYKIYNLLNGDYWSRTAANTTKIYSIITNTPSGNFIKENQQKIYVHHITITDNANTSYYNIKVLSSQIDEFETISDVVDFLNDGKVALDTNLVSLAQDTQTSTEWYTANDGVNNYIVYTTTLRNYSNNTATVNEVELKDSTHRIYSDAVVEL